jgi:hypothetical protein
MASGRQAFAHGSTKEPAAQCSVLMICLGLREVAAPYADAQKLEGQLENAGFKSQSDSTGILHGMYSTLTSLYIHHLTMMICLYYSMIHEVNRGSFPTNLALGASVSP